MAARFKCEIRAPLLYIPLWSSLASVLPGEIARSNQVGRCGVARLLLRPTPFLLQLQGAVMVASCVQMLVGFSGLIGFLMRFIGPLTIAPTISLVALPLFDSAGSDAGIHWGISAL